MLKIAAFIVIGFFAILWGTGNSLGTLQNGMMHWADGNTHVQDGGDWGS